MSKKAKKTEKVIVWESEYIPADYAEGKSVWIAAQNKHTAMWLAIETQGSTGRIRSRVIKTKTVYGKWTIEKVN